LPPASPTPHPALPSGERRLIRLWAPVFLYMAVIFGLSSISSVPPLPGGISDKTAHGWLYAGFGAVIMRTLAGGGLRGASFWALVRTIVVGTAYGASDEFHQLFVPGRSCELGDLLADAAGTTAGAGAIWAWAIISRRFLHLSHGRS
jgi:VanZ family protein